MKKLVVIFILFLGMKQLPAQSYMRLSTYQDTANYLIHEIEMKKSLFKSKPFSVLLDSLKIDPALAIIATTKTENFGKSVIFAFNQNYNFNQQHFIIVEFQSVPNAGVLFPIFYPSIGMLGGIGQIINTYNSFIVTDVLVKDYTNDEPTRHGITDNSDL